jgi:hypothetical protein
MRKKPNKPAPRIARLLCPGQDFQAPEHAEQMQLQLQAISVEPPSACDLRAFDEACARAYWLALLR